MHSGDRQTCRPVYPAHVGGYRCSERNSKEEEIVQITLSETERRALDKSAENVRELLRVMEPAP